MVNIQVTWNFGNMNNQKRPIEREELQQDNDSQQQPQQNQNFQPAAAED